MNTSSEFKSIRVPLLGLFTEAELQSITRAIGRVWDECAYDLLQSVADDKGKNINSVSVSRAVVIEVSLDASRPERFLGEDKSFSKEAMIIWNRIPYKEKIALAKTCFSFGTYGV